MISSTLNAISVRLNLNNGYDYQTGQIKTVSAFLSSLNPNTYDAQKVMNIVGAISTCLTKSIYSVQEIRTSTLTD